MTAFEDRGDRRSILCADFALDFERVDDRWTHAIAITSPSGQSRETIARAVEWDNQRDDPSRIVSPVFQELHLQTDPQGIHQALLVGRAGDHHFSAVFSLMERIDGLALSVDIADRVRGDVLGLGSTYSVSLQSGDLLDCDETRVAWTVFGNHLLFIAGPNVRIGLAEAGRRATRVQAVVDASAVSLTRRWQYSWQYLRLSDGTPS